MTVVVIALIVVIIVAIAVYFLFFSNRLSFYERAEALASRGAYTDARGLIRSRLDSNPADFRAHYQMSRIYALEGNQDNELHHLKEVKRINNYSPNMDAMKILNRIGEIYYNQERFQESYESFLDAFNAIANNQQAAVYLAFMAVGQGQFEIAERFFKFLVRSAPQVADYHIARGVCLSILKKKEALDEFEAGLNIKPQDVTARFLTALQAFRLNSIDRSRELIGELLPAIQDPNIKHIAHRLAAGIFYQARDYDRALEYAEKCLEFAREQNWASEEHDSRISIACMAMLTGDLDKANENLLELEIRNPQDQLVLRVSDFRMDLEEGVATIDKVSPRGFDFLAHMHDWVRNRFPDDAIFNLSGLRMEEDFDILEIHSREPEFRPAVPLQPGIDFDELISRFNELKSDDFNQASQQIIALQGFSIESRLPYRERDGADFICSNNEDKKTRALFRIRQWTNQPISDIFLRDMQNKMNELGVQLGFVVAGARLTPGAETALENLNQIQVINEVDFGRILKKILR